MARIAEASAPLARLVTAPRTLVAPDGMAAAQEVRAVAAVVEEEARAGLALPPASEVPPRKSRSLDLPPKPRVHHAFAPSSV